VMAKRYELRPHANESSKCEDCGALMLTPPARGYRFHRCCYCAADQHYREQLELAERRGNIVEDILSENRVVPRAYEEMLVVVSWPRPHTSH